MKLTQKVDFPLRPVLPRLAISVIGLASIALLAILYVNYPHIYYKAMTLIIFSVGPHPFIDWEWIPSSIECWHKGVDVYLHVTCWVPDPNVPFIYSPLWLRLTFIRFVYGWNNLFGLSFAVLFFLSLAFLPSRRTGTFDFVVMLFSAVSSATVEAMERANVDLIMFLLIIVGVLACGSRLPVRFAGYALITLAGLLKFYPLVALTIAIRERPAIFAAIALAVTAALGGLVFSYYEELVRVVGGFLGDIALFHPLNWGAKQLPGGLGFIISKVAAKLFNQDATSAGTIGQLVSSILLLLLIVQALASAIWLGRRCQMRYAVAHLGTREADFLLAGAALICGCFFAGDNALYRGIYLLLALPGLLTLAHQWSLQLARVALRGICVAIVFVLWFPFVQRCALIAVVGSNWSDVHKSELNRMDQAVLFAMWLCDQLAWWWIAIVLLAVLGALVLNSPLWAALSRLLPLRRISVYSEASVESPVRE